MRKLIFDNKISILGLFLGDAVVIFSMVILTILISMDQHTFQHDFSSYIVVIKDLLKSHDGFYNTYFDIKPPFFYILLTLFFAFFGLSLKSAYIIYSIFIFLFYFGIVKWIRNRKSNLNGLQLWINLFCIFCLSDLFLDMFFPIEIIGITFIIFALLLDKAENSPYRVFLISLLFSIAGQTKEVFAFTSLGYLFILVSRKNKLFLNIILFISATFLIYFIEFFYLSVTNSLDSYRQVLKYKSFMFGLDPYLFFIKNPGRFSLNWIFNYTFLGFFSVILLAVLFTKLVIMRRIQVRHFKFLLKENQTEIIILFFICLGVLLQSKGIKGHYAVALTPILFLCVINSIYNKHISAGVYTKLVMCLLLIFPNIETQISSVAHMYKVIVNFKENMRMLESKESTNQFELPVNDCLQVAYGWKAGAYYYYSGATPCSKYFISSLVFNNPNLWSDFQKTLLKNPPSEIFYDKFGAAVDIDMFEKSVFPYRKVLDSCYNASEIPSLYKRKVGIEVWMRECIDTQLRKMDQGIS